METTNNHIIQAGVAFPANGTFIQPAAGYTILCAAIQASDNQIILFHGRTQPLFTGLRRFRISFPLARERAFL